MTKACIHGLLRKLCTGLSNQSQIRIRSGIIDYFGSIIFFWLNRTPDYSALPQRYTQHVSLFSYFLVVLGLCLVTWVRPLHRI